jgi:hypothetical protein
VFLCVETYFCLLVCEWPMHLFQTALFPWGALPSHLFRVSSGRGQGAQHDTGVENLRNFLGSFLKIQGTGNHPKTSAFIHSGFARGEDYVAQNPSQKTLLVSGAKALSMATHPPFFTTGCKTSLRVKINSMLNKHNSCF